MFKLILIFLIEFYQKYLSFDRGLLMALAPGGACRFDVTCSEYTKQMIIKHGALQGGFMGIKRILKCR
jgi:putative component of membrane protein insertase Oxa1/YidC/SpoIIIJ protein YidD